jgi:hypothetical protein
VIDVFGGQQLRQLGLERLELSEFGHTIEMKLARCSDGVAVVASSTHS